ncbi:MULTISPECIES: SpoIIE family protein phosphatase [Alkalihalophilus]|uniref:Indirect negative regulator of sigma-B activity n=2 Tax=Alkalihalophilus pseudofirmus TaxID=79885 RepID=D3FRY8_ALKPO|nr:MULTISPECIES: SpoIIE family protein phosphatase [Alkalihalophilus]ADC49898.1 indirect negative regulator of sigma-B activity [Alkalihalophilus pseudofirmus OF4]MDV2887123.1 SpoIIE family protein phosphatase [Alkalihalophilus pseudofirmus]MEC2071884.1 SpoIIE family protein phosphatase [Alkalihalophilus marmarensis]MED1600818.1 SpoIIE family protein phosphatase [Alkalihalophilus marmarensis]OLS35536.1 indirect negative regulator of sigma-B activity [Alkalihalophilus pseudofirmus]
MISLYENKHIEVAAVQQPKPGNVHCGDAHVVVEEEDFTLCAVVDGLGSGEGASESADAAIEVIKENRFLEVDEIVTRCNQAMVNKRGAVLTLVKVDFQKEEVIYCNFGNIGFVMYEPDGTTLQPIPIRGYLSGRKVMVKSKHFSYKKGSIFMLYSDGVKIPFSKKNLLTLGSLKEEFKHLLTLDRFAVDDVTLLVGKLN